MYSGNKRKSSGRNRIKENDVTKILCIEIAQKEPVKDRKRVSKEELKDRKSFFTKSFDRRPSESYIRTYKIFLRDIDNKDLVAVVVVVAAWIEKKWPSFIKFTK